MDEGELLARVRTLRASGCAPKRVARALGVTSAEATRLVREVAREQALSAPEPRVVGCWVSPGWSGGLQAPPDWPDTSTPDGIGNGIVLVLVAREHRYGRVSVAGYLVDVYCLGVKNVIGPMVMRDDELPAFVRTYFLVYQAPALAVPLEIACELVWGAVAYARGLGFEPHREFEEAAGLLGEWEPTGAVRFGLDGAPYFVAGVDDDATDILGTLGRSVGEGNFGYLVAV